MRGAFVIRLGSETQPADRQFGGWIEEVDSGRELRFRTTDELLRFLADCFERSRDLDRPSQGGDDQSGGD